MHIKKIRPYITLWKVNSVIDFPQVKQGNVKRDFLDKTHNGHGYHCPPITSANVSGWEFILPQDVTVIWDGIYGTDKDHIKILNGEYYNGKRIVETVSGNGILRFLSNVIIETDRDHYCIVKGSPNYFFEGAQPLEVILRTEHHNLTETFFGWRILKPNVEITFPKGMPFMFIKNYPKDLLENTDISLKNLENNKSLFNDMQSQIYKNIEMQKTQDEWVWSGNYKKGINVRTPKGTELKMKPILDTP